MVIAFLPGPAWSCLRWICHMETGKTRFGCKVCGIRGNTHILLAVLRGRSWLKPAAVTTVGWWGWNGLLLVSPSLFPTPTLWSSQGSLLGIPGSALTWRSLEALSCLCRWPWNNSRPEGVGGGWWGETSVPCLSPACCSHSCTLRGLIGRVMLLCDSGTSKVAAFHVLGIPRIPFDTQHPECPLFQVLWRSGATRG